MTTGEEDYVVSTPSIFDIPNENRQACTDVTIQRDTIFELDIEEFCLDLSFLMTPGRGNFIDPNVTCISIEDMAGKSIQ